MKFTVGHGRKFTAAHGSARLCTAFSSCPFIARLRGVQLPPTAPWRVIGDTLAPMESFPNLKESVRILEEVKENEDEDMYEDFISEVMPDLEERLEQLVVDIRKSETLELRKGHKQGENAKIQEDKTSPLLGTPQGQRGTHIEHNNPRGEMANIREIMAVLETEKGELYPAVFVGVEEKRSISDRLSVRWKQVIGNSGD
ncbi:hypothetical protein BJ165DRAFT_1411196 [Panaeolus papilionaceus]|nr:hypothetical protein BJ165DRAFT_1411196 [Panaeolus papilionaceus]